MPRVPAIAIGSIRALLADRAPAGRKRLRDALERMMEVFPVGEAATGRGLMRLARSRQPAVIVIRTSLERRDLLRAARQIKADHPEIQIIAVTSDPPKEFLRIARGCGVHYCIPLATLEIRLPSLVRLAYRDHLEARRG